MQANLYKNRIIMPYTKRVSHSSLRYSFAGRDLSPKVGVATTI